MIEKTFTFKASDGEEIFAYNWRPENENNNVKGIVQIAHGMAEAAHRYKRFAEKLVKEGYIVYANDHRGHGKTAPSLDEIGYIGPDGYNRMVQDMKEFTDLIRDRENKDLPLFLFGHSMGSFLAQRYISHYGDNIQGVILSGTSGDQGFVLNIGIRIAKREVAKKGPKARSPRLNNLSFGSYNKKFEPSRTEFDWLTRDEKEVDKYIKDPYCGGIFTTSFYYDFFKGLKENFEKSNLENIPKNLPIYIFAGDKDPVGNMGKGVLKLVKTYQRLGIKDLEYNLYKDGRHEMLNEINRDEVMEDVINWLDKHI
ncbi:alpha-beta hydrolase superfamily lysophospholipase [Keratinibaculum paraultunense]|uniref:Alpha-beta hydrolase superfamily lysophospholipase n=1 Tax=Keratinibaculum paraultunense TaxID=1278232 RepID=A0A4R3KX83_9FIRM|nr:alpha/beta hydrolase [Keratinibaculum paraultunense]QQY79305.1 alpha/beta hydrolase [Keratinibaculum paraultunense]TCS89440.1 alpha-beta hydrolase superfamily lysophospholipase [Keratinibaculum paraultunense]